MEPFCGGIFVSPKTKLDKHFVELVEKHPVFSVGFGRPEERFWLNLSGEKIWSKVFLMVEKHLKNSIEIGNILKRFYYECIYIYIIHIYW